MKQQPYDADPPCEVCGLFPEECICPECSVCGVQGDPNCYRGGPYGHDMEKSVAQEIEHQRFVVKDLEYQYKEAKQVLDYLEEQANRQGD